MGAGENQDISRERPCLPDDPVGPLADLPAGFTSRATVAKELPARPFGLNLGEAAALVIAVIPLDEIRLNAGHLSKTGQFAGSRRTLEWAAQNGRERKPFQPLSQAKGIALAALCQRQVGKPSVLPGDGPGRFSVPRQIYDGKSVAHGMHVQVTADHRLAGQVHPSSSGLSMPFS